MKETPLYLRLFAWFFDWELVYLADDEIRFTSPRCRRCQQPRREHLDGLCFGRDACPGEQRFLA